MRNRLEKFFTDDQDNHNNGDQENLLGQEDLGGQNGQVVQAGQLGGNPNWTIEQYFQGIVNPVAFTEASCQAGAVVEGVTPIATVDVKMEREGDVVKVKWDVPNPSKINGVIILDMFRGYLRRLMEDARAQEDWNPINVALEVQEQLNAIYPLVKNNQNGEFEYELHGERLPHIRAVKPQDRDYHFINIGGHLKDVGTCILALMSAFLEEATEGRVSDERGFTLFTEAGFHNTVLAMSHNEMIRSGTWMDTLGQLQAD